jgi:hypothetical protein
LQRFPRLLACVSPHQSTTSWLPASPPWGLERFDVWLELRPNLLTLPRPPPPPSPCRAAR